MKITCPKNSRHTRFITTAHEVHEWVVDKDGQFIRDANPPKRACIEVAHGPTQGNDFTCLCCGSQATVEE